MSTAVAEVTLEPLNRDRVWFNMTVRREIRMHRKDDPAVEALLREFMAAFDMTLAVAKDPGMIWRASEASIAGCVQTALRLNLAPGGHPPRAYLVPREGSLSYSIAPAGIRELAARHGQIVQCYRLVEGDEYSVRQSDGLRVTYSPVLCADRSARKEIGYLCWVESAATQRQLYYEFMDPLQIAKRRAVSKTAKVWDAWPEEMALKTVLHRMVATGKITLTTPGDVEVQHILEATLIDTAEEDERPAPRGMAALDRVLARPELTVSAETVPDAQAEIDRRAAKVPVVVAEAVQTQAPQPEPAKAQREETPEEAHARQENEAYLKAHPQPTLPLGAK